MPASLKNMENLSMLYKLGYDIHVLLYDKYLMFQKNNMSLIMSYLSNFKYLK